MTAPYLARSHQPGPGFPVVGVAIVAASVGFILWALFTTSP